MYITPRFPERDSLWFKRFWTSCVGILEQINRYVHSVMRLHEENRIFSGFPTMAIIFYNGRENWDPLKLLENGYPKYFHGAVLPFTNVFPHKNPHS